MQPIEIGRSSQGGIEIVVSNDLQPLQEPDRSAPTVMDHTLTSADPSDIWKEVERIRSSHAMSGCNRLLQLLNFVVSSTLRGEAGHLKETTIGVEVFGRSPDYDPKVDTIVRSQAWRLRTKLHKYYSSEGLHDPMVIEIPTGQYVPAFHVREQLEIG
jgi:hypothetical protein